MKNIGFLSIVLLSLTGCYSSNENEQFYQDNLRAPVYQPYQTAAKLAETAMPQSVTQPLNINPVPAGNGLSAQSQAVTPQQPLVQTIVIPQYTPQPNMLPYATAGYGTSPVMTMPPMGNSQLPVMPTGLPQADIISNNMPQMPATQAPMPATQAPIPATQAPIQVPATPLKSSNFSSEQTQKQVTEGVYPSWAASDFVAPKSVDRSEDIVYFKNPNRNETVQCAAIDAMCIASYQQQGYIRTNGLSDIKPVAPRPEYNNAGYPRTEWDDDIPRW